MIKLNTCLSVMIVLLLSGCPDTPDLVPDPEGEDSEGELLEGEIVDGEEGEGAVQPEEYLGGVLITYSDYAFPEDGQVFTSGAGFNRIESEGEVEEVFPIDTCRISAVVNPPTVEVFPLDAGEPGTLIVGEQTVSLEYAVDGSGEETLSYVQVPTFLRNVLPGEAVLVSFPGGADLPPFELESEVMEQPRFSQPVFRESEFNDEVEIDFTSNVPLRWDATTPGDRLEVNILVNTLVDSVPVSKACFCLMRDDGRFDIPASIITQLGYNEDTLSYSFYAVRVKDDFIPLNTASGPGVVLMDSRASTVGITQTFSL